MSKTILHFPEPVRLNIGGGTDKIAGFLNVDPYREGADIPYSALEMPIEDNSVEQVLSSHSAEHFSKYDVPKLFGNIFRVLKPGGKFTVEVPDFLFCVEDWLKHRNHDFEMDRIFGLQTHPGEEHKMGFTREFLEEYLTNAGFVIEGTGTVWSHETICLLAICRKP